MAFRLCQFSIPAASGSSYVLFGRGDPARANISVVDYAEILPGGSLSPIPPVGRLRGVSVRLQSSGGWTFATGRIRVCQPRNPLLYPFAPLTYPTFIAEAQRLLYDSGDLVAGDFVESDPDEAPMIQEEFGANFQPYDGFLATSIEWTTSAGAGTSTIDVVLHTDEDD